MEARIYAENPQNDFLPTSGRLIHVRTPEVDDVGGLRVDSGVVAGDVVSTFYDPMIAKLIAYGDTRDEALSKLEKALRNYQVSYITISVVYMSLINIRMSLQVSGLANNIDFLVKVVRHPGFSAQIANTGFFTNNLPGILESLTSSYHGEQLDDHLRFGICTYIEALKQPVGSGLWSGNSEQLSNWRSQRLKNTVIKAVNVHEAIDVLIGWTDSHGAIGISLSGSNRKESYRLLSMRSKQLISSDSRPHSSFSVWNCAVELDGHIRNGTVSIYSAALNQSRIVDVWLDGCTGDDSTHYQFTVPIDDFFMSSDNSQYPVAFSPMPGKIIQILAAEGSVVHQGDPLAILEAMKMEHVVCAPTSG